MANIKNMQMGKALCQDSRIRITKSMLGLKTTATYVPTDSIIDARTLEYTPEDGDRLKKIFEQPRERLSASIGDFHPQSVPNGHYMVELCASRDGAFVALMLQQFFQMRYEPVSDVLIFDGDEAKTVLRLF